MSDQKTKEVSKAKTNPLNWMLGFEYMAAIVMLLLATLGYILWR